jgi:4-hydroxybenzoate polyprenyltransferase
MLHKFLELRLWVAVCVGALAKFCQLLVCPQHFPWFSPAVRLVVAATLVIYHLDLRLDPPPTMSPGTQRVSGYILSSASLWLMYEIATAPGHVTWLVLVGLVPCALYAVRWDQWGGALQLKAVPWLKAPFVGAAVSFAVATVPALTHKTVTSWASSPKSWWVAVSLMCFCAANANLFDLPDEDMDRAAHAATVPVLLGHHKARLIGALWTCLGAVCAAFTSRAATVPLLGLGVALLLAHALVRPDTKKATLALWVDSCLTLPLILRTILS